MSRMPPIPRRAEMMPVAVNRETAMKAAVIFQRFAKDCGYSLSGSDSLRYVVDSLLTALVEGVVKLPSAEEMRKGKG